MGTTPPRLPVNFQKREAFERKEFTCQHCGALTVCDGAKDSYWEIKTGKCVCGNNILIRVCVQSYGVFHVTKQKDGTLICHPY